MPKIMGINCDKYYALNVLTKYITPMSCICMNTGMMNPTQAVHARATD